MSQDSDSALRRDVAELLRIGPRRGVARLISDAEATTGDDELKRFATIVGALCAQNSTWVSEFRRRERRQAKCPARLRSVLSRTLADVPSAPEYGVRLTAQDVLRRARRGESRGSIVIKDRTELGFGPGYRHFLAGLYTLRTQNKTPVDLTVRFDCDVVYVHGLALLAAWCERHAAGVRLESASDSINRYLDVTGFRRVVEQQVTISEPLWDATNHVALTRVEREDLQRADQVASRIVDLYRRHNQLSDDNVSPVRIVFAELVENVYRHARSNYGAYVMAQAFPKTKKLHIAIVDTGIGIYASFRESDSEAVRRRATNEKEAIEAALEKLVTSKTAAHSGYGLYVVRRLAELNKGQWRITSGRVTK